MPKHDNSKVFIYSTSGTQLTGKMTYKKCIELPKMVEEVIMFNGRTYFVFESCSNHWKSRIKLAAAGGLTKSDIVGKVCGFNNSFIFK